MNSEDNWEEDDKFNIELGNHMEDMEDKDLWEESAVQTVPRLIRSTGRLKNYTQMMLITVNSM
jgi:hypothetical protein